MGDDPRATRTPNRIPPPPGRHAKISPKARAVWVIRYQRQQDTGLAALIKIGRPVAAYSCPLCGEWVTKSPREHGETCPKDKGNQPKTVCPAGVA